MNKTESSLYYIVLIDFHWNSFAISHSQIDLNTRYIPLICDYYSWAFGMCCRPPPVNTPVIVHRFNLWSFYFYFLNAHLMLLIVYIVFAGPKWSVCTLCTRLKQECSGGSKKSEKSEAFEFHGMRFVCIFLVSKLCVVDDGNENASVDATIITKRKENTISMWLRRHVDSN